MAQVIVPSTAEDDKWVQHLLCRTKVDVCRSPLSGRGLFATQLIKEGEVIWTERPLICRQLYANCFDVELCRHCLRPIKTLGHQLLYMAEDDADDSDNESAGEDEDGDTQAALLNSSLPLVNDQETFLSSCVECDTCGETFCSQECHDKAMELYHPATCGCAEDALDAFLHHALEHDEIFTSMKCLVEYGIMQHKNCTEDAPCSNLSQTLQPFLALCYIPWHSRPDIHSEPVAALEVALESAKLLRQCITVPVPRCCESLFQPLMYSRLAGALALNNICITFPSPQQQYYHLLMEQGTKLPGSLTTALGSIAKVQRQRHINWDPQSQLQFPYFPDVEGTGLFPRTALLNHSCDASAAYEFVGSNSLLLLATRDIHIGEEITISYCDETGNTHQRQEELRHWGFVCRCNLCVLGY